METLKKMFGKLGDTVAVSAWFFVCCIPVFTTGAAVSALYYAENKSICNNRGYVSREFFHAFRENFGKATGGWLFHLALLLVFGFDFYLTASWTPGWPRLLFQALFLLLMLAVLGWDLWFQAYTARFDDSLKVSLANAGKLALLGFAKTAALLLLHGIVIAVCMVFLPAVLLLPGTAMLVTRRVLEKSFVRIMSEKDRALEQERNRQYV